MIPITKTGATIKFNSRNIYTNICITPNGQRIARVGGFYYKVNNNNTVTNTNIWYIGHEKINNKYYEIWQRNKATDQGYVIVESKKLIA